MSIARARDIEDAETYSFKNEPTLSEIAAGLENWLVNGSPHPLLFREIEYGFALALGMEQEWFETNDVRSWSKG